MKTFTTEAVNDEAPAGQRIRVEGVLLVDSYNCAYIGASSLSYDDGSLIRLKNYDRAIERIMSLTSATIGGPLTVQLPAAVEGLLEAYELFGSGLVLAVDAIHIKDDEGRLIVVRST